MKYNHRLGVVSVSFRDRTPEEILKEAKDAGLVCVEWGSDTEGKAALFLPTHLVCYNDFLRSFFLCQLVFLTQRFQFRHALHLLSACIMQ